MSKTKIVLNRQSDLILDGAQITAPVGIILTDVAGAQDAISDAVSAEEAERISGDAKLQEGLTKEEGQRVIAVSAEEAARIAGDADLQSQMDNVISNIDPAALDSLSEIVGAFQTADGDINNAITTLANAASSDLSDEAARAIAAEAKLTSDLSDEVTARIADVDTEEARAKVAEAKLTSDLSSEEAARIAAVDAEEARAIAAELVLTIDLANEVGSRERAIDAEETRAIAAEDVLTSDLSDEVAARIADVDAEEARAIAAESGLKSDINVEKGRIDAILDGSDVNLDQFKEVVAFVESIDMTNDNALMSAVSNINDSISTKESRAKAAEAKLTSDLSAEGIRAGAAESKLTSDLGTESARAIAAEAGLTADLGIEVARAKAAEGALDAAYKAADVSMDAAYKAADSALQSNINTEAAERLAADITLQANLDAETSRAQGAEAGISSDLSDEVAARIADVNAEEARAIAAEAKLTSDLSDEAARAIAAENGLSADLTAEAIRAQGAEAKLTSDLSDEAARAIAAEGVLQGNIDVETSRIDAILLASDADKDSFAEIVTLINSVDTTNDEAFAGYVLSNNAALSAEESRAMAAEAGLSSDLSDEAARAISAEASLSADLSTETADRIAGDATGAAALSDQRDLMFANFNTTNSNLNALTDRTEAADATLTSDLSSEVANRVAGDAALQLSLDNEVADRTAADQAIQANLDAETARATAAEGVLTSDLSDEVAARIAAINELDTKSSDGLNTEIARSMAVEAVLTADLGTETARAIAAEAKLTSDLGAEFNRATAAESQLHSDLGTETARAEAAEAKLTSDLGAEEARAIAAEAKLTSDLSDEVANRIDAVSTEESARIAGDEYLQSQMDNVISNIDPAALDSLTEIVAAFQTADGDINNAITVLAESASNGLNAEVARATGAEEQLGSDLSDEITRAEEAEAGIITMVGYENMNTYTQGLWDDFGNDLANSADGLAQANQELTSAQGFIAQASAVLNDGNTSYPVEVTFGDGDNAWTQTFESQGELDRQLRSFYEKQDYAYRTIDYWSNIDGEQNLANFEGWLNFRTSRNINETAHKFSMELDATYTKLAGLIDAEKVRAEEVEAGIITMVGYDEMGGVASRDYANYSYEVKRAEEISNVHPGKIQDLKDLERVLVAVMSDNIFPVTIEGTEYADADSLQVTIDEFHAQVDELTDELNTSYAFLDKFGPDNIVNFESWVDYNQKVSTQESDSEIITSVGYESMGTIALEQFEFYGQKVKDAENVVESFPAKIQETSDLITILQGAMSDGVYPVTVDGTEYSDADSLQVTIDEFHAQVDELTDELNSSAKFSSTFGPINIVNFESWLDDKQNVSTQKGDADIVTAVGFKDMGGVASKDYSIYVREVSEAIKSQRDLLVKMRVTEDHLNLLQGAMSIGEFPVTVNGDEYADADLLQVAIDAVVNDYGNAKGAYNAAVTISKSFGPINIVNFESWIDYNQNSRVDKDIKRVKEATEAERLRATDAEKTLEVAISDEIERAMEAEAGLDDKIADIISNTDITSIDSFSEVVDKFGSALDTVIYVVSDYVVSNRPTMTEFNESTDGLTTAFTADIITGTHIVFLNGLMQFEGRDYAVAASAARQNAMTAEGKKPEQSLEVIFYTAPSIEDVLNVYGVQTGIEAPDGHPKEGDDQSRNPRIPIRREDNVKYDVLDAVNKTRDSSAPVTEAPVTVAPATDSSAEAPADATEPTV